LRNYPGRSREGGRKALNSLLFLKEKVWKEGRSKALYNAVSPSEDGRKEVSPLIREGKGIKTARSARKGGGDSGRLSSNSS